MEKITLIEDGCEPSGWDIVLREEGTHIAGGFEAALQVENHIAGG